MKEVIIVLNLSQQAVEDMLVDLERLKAHLLKVYQEETVLGFTNTRIKPMYRDPLEIHGYKVFQFAYAGSLPLNKMNDKKLKRLTRSYMEWCTHNIYNTKESGLPFEKAKVFIQHFYKDYIISDLDNRNHKYILDAIRMAQIIKDDNWQSISLDIAGYSDKTNHVQVYVVEDHNKHDFAKYLDDNKYQLIKKPLPHEMFIKETEQFEQHQTEEIEPTNFW